MTQLPHLQQRDDDVAYFAYLQKNRPNAPKKPAEENANELYCHRNKTTFYESQKPYFEGIDDFQKRFYKTVPPFVKKTQPLLDVRALGRVPWDLPPRKVWSPTGTKTVGLSVPVLYPYVKKEEGTGKEDVIFQKVYPAMRQSLFPISGNNLERMSKGHSPYTHLGDGLIRKEGYKCFERLPARKQLDYFERTRDGKLIIDPGSRRYMLNPFGEKLLYDLGYTAYKNEFSPHDRLYHKVHLHHLTMQEGRPLMEIDGAKHMRHSSTLHGFKKYDSNQLPLPNSEKIQWGFSVGQEKLDRFYRASQWLCNYQIEATLHEKSKGPRGKKDFSLYKTQGYQKHTIKYNQAEQYVRGIKKYLDTFQLDKMDRNDHNPFRQDWWVLRFKGILAHAKSFNEFSLSDLPFNLF
jgi:hypothetical protein